MHAATNVRALPRMGFNVRTMKPGGKGYDPRSPKENLRKVPL